MLTYNFKRLVFKTASVMVSSQHDLDTEFHQTVYMENSKNLEQQELLLYTSPSYPLPQKHT